MKRTRLLVLTVLASQLMAACTVVGPNYRVPETAAVQRASAQGGFLEAKGAHVALTPVEPHWWRLYDDPQLDELVQQALSANTQLRVAAANLRRAMWVAHAVDAEGDVHAEAVAVGRRAREAGEAYLLPETIPVVNEANVGIKLAYQIDLFGQLKRGEEAAHANVEAEAAAQDLARVAVVGETVQAYVQACAATHEAQVLSDVLAVESRSLNVARRLVTAGRLPGTEVDRAQVKLAALGAQAPRFVAERAAARYRIAALLGRTPQEQGGITCSHLPQLRQPMPVGDGAALLKRRPDVRQAERQLAAATARIGVATADLYPSIAIGASAGLTGLAEHLGQGRTQRWGLGGLISWRIPDAGARARVKVTEAEAEASLARFDGVVFNALREVETALNAYAQDLDRLTYWQEAHRQARKVARESQQLYKAGRSPYQYSLDADRTLTSVETSLASAEAAVTLDQVKVFMTLGGGWTDAPVAHASH